MIKLDFAFLCNQKWEDLTGQDEFVRYCGNCAKEVISLAALAEQDASAILRLSANADLKLCVAARTSDGVEPAQPWLLQVGNATVHFGSERTLTELEAIRRIGELLNSRRLNHPNIAYGVRCTPVYDCGGAPVSSSLAEDAEHADERG